MSGGVLDKSLEESIVISGMGVEADIEHSGDSVTLTVAMVMSDGDLTVAMVTSGGDFTGDWVSTLKFKHHILLYHEPLQEKMNNSGFRPGPTHTGLCSHRSMLKA